MSDERLTKQEFHKQIAAQTNNAIWPILDKDNPKAEELDEALQFAFTSRFHWSEIGTPINLARADYMISRVYSAMKMPEMALRYATRSLQITEDEGVGDWDLAFALEAITRAHAVAGNQEKYEKFMGKTEQAIEDIADEKDKTIVQGELSKIIFES